MFQRRHALSGETAGTLAAFGAYSIWGLFPIYWRLLSSVDSFQILANRLLWASLFCVVLLTGRRRMGEFLRLFTDRRRAVTIALSSVTVTVNWGLYIWAVNSGKVVESALGYYINPLVSVAFGAIFFKERVDGWTKAAVAVASLGIVGAAVLYGSVPVVSLALAFTFAAYGAIKKRLHLEPILGLAAETLLMSPLAFVLILQRQISGSGGLVTGGILVTSLLIFAGVVTAVPLILFGVAANSISLQKMGFIQYVSPTGQLLLGLLVFGERPTPSVLIAFAGVLVAVVIYSSTRRASRP